MSGMIYLPGDNITINGNTIGVSENFALTGNVVVNSISATTISGGTISSGGTNLYDIFTTLAQASGVTQVFGGTNINIGGSSTLPVVDLINSPSINGLTVSGTGNFNVVSATTLSASTINSGSTNLYNIFETIGTGIQSVAPGSNIVSGGTFANETLSLVASPSINQLTTSGNVQINASITITDATHTNIFSASTIYLGSTNLYKIFQNIGGALVPSVRTISTSQNILDTDYTLYCISGLTATLPDATTHAEYVYNIKNGSNSLVTANTTSGQTIDNQTAQTITQGANMQIQSTGQNWIIL